MIGRLGVQKLQQKCPDVDEAGDGRQQVWLGVKVVGVAISCIFRRCFCFVEKIESPVACVYVNQPRLCRVGTLAAAC